MKSTTRSLLVLALSLGLGACGGSDNADVEEERKVEASGKQATELDAVPDEVMAVARAALPELNITGAEYETRDGNEYYEVGGTLADGSEWELDMTKVNGAWTVVEKQRDIGMELVPDHVSGALETKFPEWHPDRIIESDQGDGVIIYEFFGKDDAGESTKIEIKWAEGHAEILVDEWLH
jgi:hypothetical protein